MKFLFLTASLVFSSATMAINNDLFSTKELKAVLMEIDNVCGDTWCEGDYNFRFNSFSCEKKAAVCELDFQFIKQEEGAKDVFSNHQICRFHQIKTYRQLMDNKSSLNESFLEELTDCITTKEYEIKF